MRNGLMRNKDIEILENALMFYAEEGISTDKDAQTELDNAWITIKQELNKKGGGE